MDREREIKEIGFLLVSIYDNAKTLQDVTYRAIATALYDAGYRKQIVEQTKEAKEVCQF